MVNKEYAGFWIRFTAVCIDMLLLSVFTALPLTLIYGTRYWSGEAAYYGVWDGIISYVVPVLLTLWFWQRFLGTPGKMILKLKIVDEKTGKKMTLRQSIGRYFAYIPATVPLFLGFFWIGWDKKKQGLHDHLAGTAVIREHHPRKSVLESPSIKHLP
ncbi:RDD family protein [Alteromonas pelagimontana]|uniref:RDD family protein n=1 Tax=Alteromonas pelagimontana TaxID=1858656 RepID=A0A6M4MA67_9ALTE|nr:RDD family protein [Alteromonas pelagimontana]QJR79718.1 RDD family protein [Alteromonas pelagimontana]